MDLRNVRHQKHAGRTEVRFERLRRPAPTPGDRAGKEDYPVEVEVMNNYQVMFILEVMMTYCEA